MEDTRVISKPKTKSISKLKKECWDACSIYIRTRDKVCIFHMLLSNNKIHYPCRCVGVLQACHKISRSKSAIKFDERNLFAGCSGSNVWANFNQLEWDRLWRKLWPEDEAYLERTKGARVKRTRGDYMLMTIDFQQRLERLT